MRVHTLEFSQLRAPGDEPAKDGPQNQFNHRVGGCSTDVCPAGHTLWGEHDRERHASPDWGDTHRGHHRWGMLGTTSHKGQAPGILAVVEVSAGARLSSMSKTELPSLYIPPEDLSDPNPKRQAKGLT